MNQKSVDVTNCNKEPVAYINEIQSFGAMLVLDANLNIVQTSANIEEWLGETTESLIGKNVDEYFTKRQIDSLLSFAAARDRALVPVGLLERRLKANAIAHLSDGFTIVELEPRDEGSDTASADSAASGLNECITMLSKTSSVKDFADQLAHCVRLVTGYDRVMIYKFHDDWHGEVIAEEKGQGIDSYMGNHFPASDIPEPARKLFASNWTRLIADVSATPIAMHPKFAVGRGRPINLTLSSLRQPSAIHVEYLKNMGVGGSLSISLMLNGQLWGLVACHHNEAKYVNYWIRSVCEFIAKYASQHLNAIVESEAQNLVSRFSHLGQQIIEKTKRKSIFESMGKEALALFGANFIYYVSDQGEIEASSSKEALLPELLVKKLANFLKDESVSSIYFTNRLAGSINDFEQVKEHASGLIAVRMLDGYLLIFRPEYKQILTWGGNPDKAVHSSSSETLHPRQSFDAWREQVEGQSRRWSDAEVMAAQSLSSLIDASIPLYEIESRDSELKAGLRQALSHSIKLLDDLREDELVSPVFSMNLKVLQSRFSELSHKLGEDVSR